MSQPTNSTEADLPDDVAALKALLLAERATAAKLAGQNEQLRSIVKELQRALFGRRSEKGGPSRSAPAGPRGHRAGDRRR
jgi:transposase